MSVSIILAFIGFMSNFGPMPSLMLVKISPSVAP
jgi:hypothetical protein